MKTRFLKFILSLFNCFQATCQTKLIGNNVITSKEPFTLHIFFLQTCLIYKLLIKNSVEDVHLDLQNKSLSSAYIKAGRWEFAE